MIVKLHCDRVWIWYFHDPESDWGYYISYMPTFLVFEFFHHFDPQNGEIQSNISHSVGGPKNEK